MSLSFVLDRHQPFVLTAPDVVLLHGEPHMKNEDFAAGGW
jgi:hypothetical protein